MSWIENYTPTVDPNNKHKFLFKDKTDTIIVGATCEHIFEVPFSFNNYVKNCTIIYKQGFDTILEVFVEPSWVTETPYGSKIHVTLTPNQTKIFRDTVLNTFVQLRVETLDDKLLYDDPHLIWVKEPLVGLLFDE